MTRRCALGAALCVLVLAGCAGAPVQEMSNARQAVSAAEEAGVEAVAGEQIARARRLLESAQTKLQERDYRGARQDAVSARMNAVRALEIAAPKIPETP